MRVCVCFFLVFVVFFKSLLRYFDQSVYFFRLWINDRMILSYKIVIAVERRNRERERDRSWMKSNEHLVGGKINGREVLLFFSSLVSLCVDICMFRSTAAHFAHPYFTHCLANFALWCSAMNYEFSEWAQKYISQVIVFVWNRKNKNQINYTFVVVVEWLQWRICHFEWYE